MAPSNLQCSVVGSLSGSIVTIQVINPQSSAETARVRVHVRLTNGNLEFLTSSNFTVQAGSTINIQLTASSSISTVEDGPSPVDPT